MSKTNIQKQFEQNLLHPNLLSDVRMLKHLNKNCSIKKKGCWYHVLQHCFIKTSQFSDHLHLGVLAHEKKCSLFPFHRKKKIRSLSTVFFKDSFVRQDTLLETGAKNPGRIKTWPDPSKHRHVNTKALFYTFLTLFLRNHACIHRCHPCVQRQPCGSHQNLLRSKAHHHTIASQTVLHFALLSF